MIVYRVAKLRYEYKGLVLKPYRNIPTVQILLFVSISQANKRLASAQKNVKRVAGVLLDHLIPGEKPLPINLGQMAIQLEKSENASGKPGFQYVGEAGVNVPDDIGGGGVLLKTVSFSARIKSISITLMTVHLYWQNQYSLFELS